MISPRNSTLAFLCWTTLSVLVLTSLVGVAASSDDPDLMVLKDRCPYRLTRAEWDAELEPGWADDDPGLDVVVVATHYYPMDETHGGQLQPAGPGRVRKVLMYWLPTDIISPSLLANIRKAGATHPLFGTEVYDERRARLQLEVLLSPMVVKAYDMLVVPEMKGLLFRYAMLWAQGGVAVAPEVAFFNRSKYSNWVGGEHEGDALPPVIVTVDIAASQRAAKHGKGTAGFALDPILLGSAPKHPLMGRLIETAVARVITRVSAADDDGVIGSSVLSDAFGRTFPKCAAALSAAFADGAPNSQLQESLGKSCMQVRFIFRHSADPSCAIDTLSLSAAAPATTAPVDHDADLIAHSAYPEYMRDAHSALMVAPDIVGASKNDIADGRQHFLTAAALAVEQAKPWFVNEAHYDAVLEGLENAESQSSVVQINDGKAAAADVELLDRVHYSPLHYMLAPAASSGASVEDVQQHPGNQFQRHLTCVDTKDICFSTELSAHVFRERDTQGGRTWIETLRDVAPHRPRTVSVTASRMRIPLVIVQMHATEQIPIEMHKNLQKLIETNPEFEHRFFGSDRARKYIAKNCGGDPLKAFDSLSVGEFRADLLKWCFLSTEGGVWVDAEVAAVGPLFPALVGRKHAFMATAGSQGDNHGDSAALEDSIVACMKDSPFAKKALEKATANVLQHRSSGPQGMKLRDFTGAGVLEKVALALDSTSITSPAWKLLHAAEGCASGTIVRWVPEAKVKGTPSASSCSGSTKYSLEDVVAFTQYVGAMREGAWYPHPSEADGGEAVRLPAQQRWHQGRIYRQ